MSSPNQNPEQKAHDVIDAIDAQLRASGWAVQDKTAINLHEGEARPFANTTPIPAPPTTSFS